jgi:NADH-quinone oxidoreductase subunit J
MFHFANLDSWLGPVCFGLLAAIALVCSGSMLRARHPLQAAVSLIGVMLALSGIYVLLQSPFLGVVQVLVYAGAIMMLVVFVIMVLNRAHDHEVPRFDRGSIIGGVLVLAVLIAVARGLCAAPLLNDDQAVRGQIAPVAGGVVEHPGMTPVGGLFDMGPASHGYYILFELIGVLLLVAVVGAVLLAKRHLDSPLAAAPAAEGGHDAH